MAKKKTVAAPPRIVETGWAVLDAAGKLLALSKTRALVDADWARLYPGALPLSAQPPGFVQIVPMRMVIDPDDGGTE